MIDFIVALLKKSKFYFVDSTMSDYICEEMIGEIFQRLPLKTLLRFRSLSKSWCSHISSPDFKRKHIRHSVGKPHKILIRHKFNERDDKSKDVYTLHSEDQIMLHSECVMSITALDFPMGKIVGSCNGLLCLLDHSTGISIWNPSLRRILILPYHPSLRSFHVSVGFGFDPITNDYKIVAILHEQHVKKSLVCSMKTGTWCEIAFPITLFDCMCPRACFVNGVLHWVVSCLSDDDIEPPPYIITFNVSTNVFGKISLPEPSWKRGHLTVISGSLAAIANEYHNHTIHVRKEYNNAAYWSLVFQLRDFPKVVGNISQLTITGDLLLYVEEGYKAYNLETGVCSMVAKFNASCGVDMIIYGESLELLDYTKSNCYRQKIWAERKIDQVQPSIRRSGPTVRPVDQATILHPV